MDSPGRTSSDILGIEVGRSTVRGVRLDQETTELTAAAECAFDPAAISVDGIIDPAVVGPALDVLIHRLGVKDRSSVRVGMTIGPRNAGVGSGPAMAGWLEAQATNLRESLTCSGGLGIAFVPSRSIDAAIKLALGSGIDLARVDLAPVAGARAIGDQVEDLICMGSGRGWQARMRDFEVLEAMENMEIDLDAPLSIVGQNVPPRSISRYGWVEIGAELDQAQRLEIGQLAPAVGAAIGVAYESPANLLLGQEVVCAPVYPPPVTDVVAKPVRSHASLATVRALTDDEADMNPDLSLDQFGHSPAAANPAESTLQLAKIDPSTKPPADPPQHQVKSDADKRLPVERQRRVPPPQTGRTPVVPSHAVPSPEGRGVGGGVAAPEPVSARVGQLAPERTRSTAQATAAGGTATATRTSTDASWGESVDASDPITMFSPEAEVRHIMGKRESRLGPDVLFTVLLVSAIALLAAYLYL